jgi:hypothetical protein
MLERVRAAQDEVKAAHEKTENAKKDLEAALVTVNKLKQDIDAVLGEAKATLAEISTTKAKAVELYASIQVLTPQQNARLQETKPPELTRNQPPGTYNKFWQSGATIRIRFIGGDAAELEVVRSVAAEFGKYANLIFQFVTSGPSEIRIAFKPDQGNWSYQGTDALGIPENEPTMNIGEKDRPAILEHFGLAVGLIKEEKNPTAHIPWNRDVVYRATARSPLFWSRETVDQNILSPYKVSELPDYREFDPQSIMADSYPPEWTGGLVMGNAKELSPSDKRLLAKLYPGRDVEPSGR